MKIYKGYELVEAIALKKIEEGSLVKCKYNNYMYRTNSINLLIPTKPDQDYIENDFGADIWLNFYFELIENNEINIDKIKETEIKKDGASKYFEYENDGATQTGYSKTFCPCDIDTRIKINELVQAVKQLNKKISSI